MMRLPLVIHERLGTWARQVRPRAVGWPVVVVESRSADDLVTALGLSACPLLLLNLGGRVRAGLVELDRGLRASPETIALVLNPEGHREVEPVAREIGATLVLSGPIVPPAVMGLLARWVPLARHRAEADGFFPNRQTETEPWNLPTPDA